MADQHYRVSVGTYDLDLEELHHPAGAAPISFVPVVAGAGAVGRIIAGVLLVAVAIAFPLIGVGAAAIAAGTTVGAVSASIALTGLSLIIGGISQLLTPTPIHKAKTKATHARALASAASRTPTVQVCQSPWFTVKRWYWQRCNQRRH
jgi:predicted phage tail protein